MAYGYRSDPLLESLQGLGNSLRGASQDVLARRQLDLQEEGMLGRQEQERNLARERTLTIEQQGQTELLKTRANIGLQQAQERRAESADVRAGEAHGVQMEAGRVGIEGKRFDIEEGRTLLPGKVAGQAAENAYRRAAASAQSASAAHQAALTQMSRAEFTAATKEVNLPNLVATLNATGNEEVAEMVMGAYPPGAKPNMLDLHRQMKYWEMFFPKGFGQLKLNRIEKDLEQETDPQNRVALRERLNNARVNMGMNPRDDLEGLDAAITSRAVELPKIRDTSARQQMNKELEDLLKVRKGFMQKGQPQPTTPEQYFAIHKNYDIMEKLMQNYGEDLGHEHLGGMRNFLIDTGEIPAPENYFTPNALYAIAAPQVNPATADELTVYQKGGTLANGTTLPPNPDIKTQAQANAYKRGLEVTELHKRTGGDRGQLAKAMGVQTSVQGTPSSPGAALSQTAQKPIGPFDAARVRVQQEIVAQLRKALGRDPTNEEVDARIQELMQPRSGLTQGLGRVGEFMRQNKPLDLLQGLGGVLSPTQRLERFREEQERNRTSIPGTGATEMQGR